MVTGEKICFKSMECYPNKWIHFRRNISLAHRYMYFSYNCSSCCLDATSTVTRKENWQTQDQVIIYMCVFHSWAGSNAVQESLQSKGVKERKGSVCNSVSFIQFDSLLTALACFWCCHTIIHIEQILVWTTKSIELYTLTKTVSAPRRLFKLYAQGTGVCFSLSSQLSYVYYICLRRRGLWTE